MFKLGLFFIISIYITCISATSYIARNAGNLSNKYTSNNKYPLRLYVNNSSNMCWYTTQFRFPNDYKTYVEPSCCVNVRSKAIYLIDSSKVEGLGWHHCIDVKKNTSFLNVNFFVDAEGYSGNNKNKYYSECNIQYQTNKQAFKGIRSYCNIYGCLTQYGWLTNNQFTNKRNC